ncbi:MAG: cyclic nucleotide-binding domain-containing protein [bacterium]
MKLSKEEIEWLFKILRQVDFLSAYSTGEIKELIERTRKKTYKPKEAIIQQGTAGKYFFVIYKGKVSVTLKKETEERSIATLSEADYFGEMSLLTGHSCSATVAALVTVEAFLLEPDDFRFILMRNHSLAKSMSMVISQRRTELSEALGGAVESGDDLLEKIMQYYQLEENA